MDLDAQSSKDQSQAALTMKQPIEYATLYSTSSLCIYQCIKV